MEVKNDDKRWIIKEHGDQLLVRRLSKDLGIDSVLANLLVQRGITTAMEAKEFFHPDSLWSRCTLRWSVFTRQ